MMIGHVYFAQAAKGPIKIGVSTNVPQRIAGLQAALRDVLNVLAVVPGTRRTEFFFHDLLRKHRITGEWFFPDQAVLDVIADVSAKGLDFVHPDFRPETEFEGLSGDEDEMKVECREMLMSIAGERRGREKISDSIERAARLTGIARRRIQTLWYLERGSVSAENYLRIRDVYEAHQAVRIEIARRSILNTGSLHVVERVLGGDS